MGSNIIHKKDFDKKIKSVKMLILDVDGVLTDGAMYYSSNGDEIKKFHTHDGMGIALLQNSGYKVAIISKEDSDITARRAKKLKIKDCFIGVINKVACAEKLLKKYSLGWEEVCFMGDDVNDMELLKKAGFSACPADAQDIVKKTVDQVVSKSGGNGAVREISNLLLSL